MINGDSRREQESKQELAAGLAEGVQTLSTGQTVAFTLYVKLVLPIDGYVFWVNANLLNESAIYNDAIFGQAIFGKEKNALPKVNVEIPGSLHFATELVQDEEKTSAQNYMIPFTLR